MRCGCGAWRFSFHPAANSDSPSAMTEPESGATHAAMTTDGSPRISKDEVMRIAKLAHLELSAGEIDRMARDLGQILAYVEQLREADVTDVPATSHGDDAGIVPRPDEEQPSLPHELALREAPSVDAGGFRVPAFVDEG
jgi:aspartyl-tRNA(Asn)/glutamyl-tRNA(Gln) amidotransferase subunit C